jgi:hypothetical protein
VIHFLATWFVMGISLAIALTLLSWIYDRFGGDLGLTGWRHETIIAVTVSLLQALIVWGIHSVTGEAAGRSQMVASVILMLSYKLTHLSGDYWEGTEAMDNISIAVIAAGQIGILVLAAILLAVLGNAR